MNLFFTGCSFTYGEDLKNPERDAWPALVARDQPFTNTAVRGGANDRMVYQVIKNIDQFDKFYIAWTEINRFTRYNTDNHKEVKFTTNSRIVTHEYVNYAKLHYTFFSSNLYNFKLWLQQIILLQSYLEKKNKKYVMINMCHNKISDCVFVKSWQPAAKSFLEIDHLDDHHLAAEYQEIQALAKDINLDKFLGWGTWAMTDLLKEYPVGATQHLLEDGHRAIAQYILQNDTN